MKASREMVLKEIEKVMTQVVENSVRVDNYYIQSCGGELIQLTIYDVWGNYIDCTIGTPFEVLYSVKTWLHQLFD